MYVCMYVRTYVCMYYVCVCVCVCMYVRTYVCMLGAPQSRSERVRVRETRLPPPLSGFEPWTLCSLQLCGRNFVVSKFKDVTKFSDLRTKGYEFLRVLCR
jgi:hypothetical protein